ncbi:glutamate carboxypeptidase [Sphingomonas gellani]|uniref:Glutamate carboxypeptidase n=1 Tax=Sphingomonas gellani TaxID=1166340 RepID=A0A1H7Z1K4_9SPHN|nr:hydrolase [Sphingomonas gellani]SEM52462.1 glutamate carboxypeptidase [Sphingomonas gellani]
MGLLKQEEDAVARIDATAMREQVERWASVNSGTGNLIGLAITADLMAEAFGTLPGTVSRVAPAPVSRVGADGQPNTVPHGDHLLVSVRPEAPVRLLLTGHMDTVYAADHPFQQVREIAPGVLNGPGVADMKGGLTVMLAALHAVEAVGVPGLGYDILLNSDEETGSLSSADLIARSARGKVAALTYEPALADGTLAGARGGTGNFAVVVRGRSAHAGRNPEEGRNALVAAARVAVLLAQSAGPALTVNPARIDGGAPNNVVPDLAILHVNFRPGDQAAIDHARRTLDRVAAEVAAEADVVVEVHGQFNRPPKPVDGSAERLFGLVRDVGADLGIPIRWRATGGVCDGNNIAAAGVPVVDTMGVRGGAIHSPDEFVLLDSLAERAALSAVTMLRLAEKGQA